VEIFESDTPLIVEKRELIQDSGGPGRHKGGLGRRMTLWIPDDEYAPIPPVFLGIQAGRYRYPPEGLFGGKPGAKAQFLVNDDPGNPYGLTRLTPGDLVLMDAAGGGGYGNPLEREPERVRQDVMDGYVSRERAREDYGVVLDSSSLEVNIPETEKLRSSMQAQGS
jgi:N-methylhydantoinase B